MVDGEGCERCCMHRSTGPVATGTCLLWVAGRCGGRRAAARDEGRTRQVRRQSIENAFKLLLQTETRH